MSEPFTGRMWPTPQAYGRGKPENSVPGLTPLDIAVRGLYAPPASNQLTLFAEAFPANRIVLLADVPAPPTIAICGRSSPESFAKLNPDGSWRKTCLGYSQVTLDGSLERFSETWPRAGMTRNGIAYLLRPLVRLTGAIACGLLPTPSAESYGTNHGGAAGRVGPIRPSLETMARRNLWPTPTEDGNYNRKGASAKSGDGLATAVKRWPTPTAQDAENNAGSSQFNRNSLPLNAAVQMWAIPTSHDYKVGRTSTMGRQLTREVWDGEGFLPGLSSPKSGSLNPTWVEWLMGYPLGWTVCEAWETRLSRRSRSGSRGASGTRRRGDD